MRSSVNRSSWMICTVGAFQRYMEGKTYDYPWVSFHEFPWGELGDPSCWLMIDDMIVL